MSKIDTWYVLADGTHADPADVVTFDGVLQHKNGVPVALRDDKSPLTSGVATKSNQKAADAGRKSEGEEKPAAPEPPATKKEVKPEPEGKKPGYKTREHKAR